MIAQPSELQGFLFPLEVQPGATINGYGGKFGYTCIAAEITSPGFAAPLKLQMLMPGAYQGSTTVITKPGTYTATKVCNGGGVLTVQFKILGATTTRPSAPKPPAKPKPPVVKPRGAADTGDGSTA